ncbi:MAG: SIMPL domain-containing protein [Woeseiaceae bacterium]|jgi:uncharacterized protein YggE
MRIIFIALVLASAATSAQSNLPDTPHIYVEGSGVVRLDPDVLRISGEINAVSLDPAEAERAVYEKSARLLETCKEHGIEAEQISASTISMSPKTEYINKRRQVVGYELSRTFEISIKAMDNYYPAVRAIVESGTASDLDAAFTISDPEPSIIRAQQLAIDDARSRAERLAHQSGAKLGKVHSITEFNLRQSERADLEPHRFLFEGELDGSIFDEIIVTVARRESSHNVQPLFQPSKASVTATVFVVYNLEN